MIIPGANILTMAHGLISRQQVQWLRFDSFTVNAAGVQVPVFLAALPIAGSFQAVTASMLQMLGLDFTKNYANFYNENAFKDPARDITGDRLTYAGKTFQIVSRTPWFDQDGWDNVLCVEIPPNA